ncbi:helix-turn-helix domain-containing protein [Streptomyces sp. AV19]|uniref:helix-turn-helix domain-containing protein n=1 Tax=Streptomyces sp. AV19 TaxID=2793068 RepID=UPI0018FE08E4|nr:helix-turn-helix transcriptional regulator [Streptomyces sp. AV19]MBH1934546.1 helix-turn-helix domain-containing protein [Streptomyces sp. AV19]MDG4530907.1 helix-turn-helix domain-containing protein [Streptomyces sp. AV19]
MPPRSNPTARQARLGAELRKLREACGMSAREAGALLGGGVAQISHIEAGRWGVSAERVRRLAAFYRADDERLIGELCAIAEERLRGWWTEYRGILAREFLDVSELEHHARAIRILQITYVPGIFQTTSYARALFSSAGPSLPEKDLAARVEHRVARRVVYERATPPPTTAIVHEAALRMRYGSRGVQRNQLKFLCEVADWPAVTLRVVPFDTDNLIGTAESVLYAVGPVPELDTVQMDHAQGGRLVDAPALLSVYRNMLNAVERSALGPDDSQKFIHRVIQEM